LYPPTVAHDKKAFEQHLRQLLGVSGELVAWQKIAVRGYSSVTSNTNHTIMGSKPYKNGHGLIPYLGNGSWNIQDGRGVL